MGIIAKQSSWNLIFIISGFAIGGITRIFLLPRFFSDNELGQLDILLTHGLLLSVIFNMGTMQTVIKFFEKFKQKGREGVLISTAIVVPLSLAILFSLFLALFPDVYAGTVNSESQEFIIQFVPVLIIILITQLLFQVFVGISTAYMRTMLPTFFAEVYMRSLVMLGIFLYYFKVLDYQTFLWYYGGIYFLQLLTIYVSLRGTYDFKLERMFPEERKEFFSYSLFALLDNGAARFISLLDVLMIGKFLEARFAAYYSIGVFVSTVIKIPLRAMNPITMSLIAKSWTNNDRAHIQELYTKSSLSQTVLAGLILVLIWAGREEFQLLLPHEYRTITWVLLWLSLGNFINSAFGVNGSILLTSPKYRMNFYLNLFLLILTVGFNVLFIPEYGINGAAFATFLSLTIFNISKYIYIWSAWGLQPLTNKHLPALMVVAAAFTGAHFWPDMGLHFILEASIKMATLGGVAIGLFYFMNVSEDLNSQTKKILRRLGVNL